MGCRPLRITGPMGGSSTNATIFLASTCSLFSKMSKTARLILLGLSARVYGSIRDVWYIGWLSSSCCDNLQEPYTRLDSTFSHQHPTGVDQPHIARRQYRSLKLASNAGTHGCCMGGRGNTSEMPTYEFEFVSRSAATLQPTYSSSPTSTGLSLRPEPSPELAALGTFPCRPLLG
jgi:hypothetical protein